MSKRMQSIHNSPVVSGPQRSFIQPGYHQNLSGSDTDVSTSTENLTAEEKRVLQNGVRQEPQGEETITDDVDTISSNTLIIHDTKIAGEHDSPFYSQNFHCQNKNIESRIQAFERDQKESYNRLCADFAENMNMHHNSRIMNPNMSLSPKTALHNVMYAAVPKSANHNSWEHYSQPTEYTRRNVNSNPTPFAPSGSYHIMAPVHSPYPPESHSTPGITEIPKDYLDQSEVLKYLAKELNHQNYAPESSNYPPLPEYPKQSPDSSKDHQMIFGSAARRRGLGMMNTKSKSAERLSVSRSHPDLCHGKLYHSEDNNAILHPMQRPETHGRVALGVDSEVAVIQANQMIELLSAENTALKTELDLYYKKVSKLQKFELEIQKVHKAHQDLVLSSEKRENLEKAIRARLEAEIRHLSIQNKQLREYLESASPHFTTRQPVSEVNESELKKELSKREVLIAQLLTQTKELLAEKERQEIELQAQRATLQEQRNHIDILDNALTNAQANVMRLEEESRKKQVYVDRVAQLQKALTNLQQSSEKRLLMEKKLRAQMEKEVQALKSQKQGKLSTSPEKKTEKPESIEGLRKTIMEYEEKIIGLEAEVSKWEQRYIEESTMRQIAVDAASVPKDAKIAALERTSQESEKLIAQARTEKLKQMDELYAANRKCAELESRIKDFESKLAEKDAMIRVLQQHSQEKDAVLQHAVLGRPPRHTRSASTVGLTTSTSHTTTTTGCSSLGRVSPSPTNSLLRKTASKPECGTSESLLSISSESSSTTLPSPSSPVTESVTASKKSIDEQLKELDSRLSSKDSIISALRAEKERYPSHFWRV